MAFWIPVAIMVAATVASSELNKAAARKLHGERDRDIAEGIRKAGEKEEQQSKNLLETLNKVDPTAQDEMQIGEDDKSLKIFEDIANANKDTRVAGINVSGDGIKQSITEGDAGEQKRSRYTKDHSRFAAVPGKQTTLGRRIAYLASDNQEQKRQGRAAIEQGKLLAEGRTLDGTLTTLAAIAQAVAMAAGTQVSFPGAGTAGTAGTTAGTVAGGGAGLSPTVATVPNSASKAASLFGGSSAQHGSNFMKMFRSGRPFGGGTIDMGIWKNLPTY